MEASPLRAYLVDDEPLAIERLARLLGAFDSVVITGSTTDPAAALEALNDETGESIDVLFLDIQMPGLTGFDLLARLAVQPFVIFTTAYDEYALRAFEVNSIDYLVKPIESAQLARALKKLDRVRPVAKSDWQKSPELPKLLQELAASLRDQRADYPKRIASHRVWGSGFHFSISMPLHTSLRTTSLPMLWSVGIVTLWIRQSSNSNAVSTRHAFCAFIARRW
jgi:DNA-binding LytR/AlgR family response regulator